MAGSLRVCRACLSRRRPLRGLFEVPDFAALTGTHVSEEDRLPTWICDGCASIVARFRSFRERCRKSRDALFELVRRFDSEVNVDEIENVQTYPALSFSETLTVDIVSFESSEKRDIQVFCVVNGNVIEQTSRSAVNNDADTKNVNCSEEARAESTAAYETGPETRTTDAELTRSTNVSRVERILERSLKNENGHESYEAAPNNETRSSLSYFSNDDDRLDSFICDGDEHVKVEHENETAVKCKRKRKSSVTRNSDRFKSRQKNSISKLNKQSNSRMVLETKQYKVIRLTREQLLMEMSQNSKSERYLNAPYKCSFCVKGFNYEDVLQNHMAKHEPKNGDFECDICHQFLPSAVSMRGHKKSHNTKYQCKGCNVIKASRQHLLEHYMLIHEGAPRTYICNVCGKSLTKRTMFQKHMRIHYPTNKITCDKCGKLFKTIETLRAHLLHHEEGPVLRHADIKRYSCDQCPKAFRYASLLYTHKVTHITTKDFYCVECDMRFKTQSNLRLHLRKSQKHIDPDTLKYVCEQCGKRYDDEKGLRHHVEWVHLKQKNYKCPKCDMYFGSQDGLRSHRKKIHDGIKAPRSHFCEICNKAFRAKAVLIKHIRVHTGERPYECSDCGRRFAQNSTMSTHYKLVHLKVQRHVNKKLKINTHGKTKNLSESSVPISFLYPDQPAAYPSDSYYLPSASNMSVVKFNNDPIQ